MATTTRTRDLVRESSSPLEYVAAATAGVSLLVVVAGVLAVFKAVPVSSTLVGVALADAMAAALALVGVALLAVGATSRADAVDTSPDPTAGVGAGVAFGAIGFAAGGLVASQTLGLSALWPLPALAVGVAATALTVLPREDVGATAPTGLLAVTVGGVVLADVITPAWTWTPIETSATFPGDVAIPVLAAFVGLLSAWTAARAYEGFGSQGKQTGAFLLVAVNAAGMLALLLSLVAFIAARGFAPATRGVKLGLFWEPVTWFYVPPLGEYVVVNAPLVWFHWPFVMQGVSLLNTVNGVAPAIVGTVWLVAGATVFSVPLGVGAAVFLTEYAEQGRFTQLVEISTNGLWSTPSIVYGLFGLAFLVPRLGNTHSILAGQLVLGAMMLPLVVITSREALKAVPDEYRDASAALGVTKWETIKSVVIPAAMPGVVTGVILGVGRIAGETAPILLVMVGEPFPSTAPQVIATYRTSVAVPFTDTAVTATYPFLGQQALLEPASALPYQLFAVITAGLGSSTGLENPMAFAWGTALVLLAVVLGFYAVGIATRVYFRRKLTA